MERWTPRTTVATVVEQNGRYLMVEERDKQSGRQVFNQPAGHLDPGETLLEAALRETREETCWQVQLTGVLGIGLYTAPSNGLTYFRTTFLARPVALLEHLARDPDIDRVHWLSYEEIRDESARMRSPLVLASIERQRIGLCYPLDLVYAP